MYSRLGPGHQPMYWESVEVEVDIQEQATNEGEAGHDECVSNSRQRAQADEASTEVQLGARQLMIS